MKHPAGQAQKPACCCTDVKSSQEVKKSYVPKYLTHISIKPPIRISKNGHDFAGLPTYEPWGAGAAAPSVSWTEFDRSDFGSTSDAEALWRPRPPEQLEESLQEILQGSFVVKEVPWGSLKFQESSQFVNPISLEEGDEEVNQEKDIQE